jgi:hypothetical protein
MPGFGFARPIFAAFPSAFRLPCWCAVSRAISPGGTTSMTTKTLSTADAAAPATGDIVSIDRHPGRVPSVRVVRPAAEERASPER